MSQPKWKYVANLGDKNPIEYGGLFVFVDETGVYPPEMERLERIDEGNSDPDDYGHWEVHRVILEPCTYVNGILSDNKFHPDKAAWFATPADERDRRPQDTTGLNFISRAMGMDEEELIRLRMRQMRLDGKPPANTSPSVNQARSATK